MSYDYQGAINAGANPNDVLNYMGSQNNYDAQGAVKAGANPQDVMKYLSTQSGQAPQQPATPQADRFGVNTSMSLMDRIKNVSAPIVNAFKSGIGQVKSAISQSRAGANPIETGLQAGAGIGQALSSPLAPITTPFSDALNKAATNASITDNPNYQKFAASKAGQTTSRVVQDISNLNTIAGTAAGGIEGKAAIEKVPELANTALETAKNTASDVRTGLENKYVSSTAQDWERVGGDYVKTDRLLNQQEAQLKNPTAPTSAHDTPSFLAQHGISPNTITEGGKFSPEKIGTVTEHLTGDAVKPFEDTLTQQLKVAQQSQPPVSVTELRTAVSNNINRMSGLTEGDRALMLNKANRELVALQNKYPKGIPLDVLNVQKGIYWKNTKFNLVDNLKPQVNGAIGSAMKDIIETKAGTDVNIKEMNGLLGNYYKAAKFLRGLEGRVPKATLKQKIGRSVVKAGAIVAGEKMFGIGGGVSGFLLSKSISHVLENASNPLKSYILNNLKETNPKAYTEAIKWLGEKEAERLSRPLLNAGNTQGGTVTPSVMITPSPTTFEPQAKEAFRTSTNKTGDIFQRNIKTNEMKISPALKGRKKL